MGLDELILWLFPPPQREEDENSAVPRQGGVGGGWGVVSLAPHSSAQPLKGHREV